MTVVVTGAIVVVADAMEVVVAWAIVVVADAMEVVVVVNPTPSYTRT